MKQASSVPCIAHPEMHRVEVIQHSPTNGSVHIGAVDCAMAKMDMRRCTTLFRVASFGVVHGQDPLGTCPILIMNLAYKLFIILLQRGAVSLMHLDAWRLAKALSYQWTGLCSFCDAVCGLRATWG